MAAQQPYKPQVSKKTPQQSTISNNLPQPAVAPLLQNRQSQKKGLSPVISVVSIILITLILFFAGYLYLQYLQNQNITESGNSELSAQKNESAKLQQIETDAKNDQIRKLNITNLDKALTEFFEQNKKYPKTIEELTPDYLKIIPLDPVTKIPYAYVPSDDFSGYSLSAALSSGDSYSVTEE